MTDKELIEEKEKVTMSLGKARVGLIGTVLCTAIGATLTTLLFTDVIHQVSPTVRSLMGYSAGLFDSLALIFAGKTDTAYNKYTLRKSKYDYLTK